MTDILAILAASIHDGVPRKDGILYNNKKASLKDRMAIAEHNSCGSDKMRLLIANGGDGKEMATTEHGAWSIDKMAADLSK